MEIVWHIGIATSIKLNNNLRNINCNCAVIKCCIYNVNHPLIPYKWHWWYKRFCKCQSLSLPKPNCHLQSEPFRVYSVHTWAYWQLTVQCKRRLQTLVRCVPGCCQALWTTWHRWGRGLHSRWNDLLFLLLSCVSSARFFSCLEPSVTPPRGGGASFPRAANVRDPELLLRIKTMAAVSVEV